MTANARCAKVRTMTKDPARAAAGRLVRKIPALKPWLEDLIQDGREAILRGHQVRGAVLRCGLRYLGIDERSHRRPEFVPVIEALDSPASTHLDAWVEAEALAARVAELPPRLRAVAGTLMEGGTMREAAKRLGVSHAAVYLWTAAYQKKAA